LNIVRLSCLDVRGTCSHQTLVHAQGIIHRDIKPDNCLITEDDVLKIVDFGVSEMFDKEGEMRTAKSAGSPAFMPPELCVPKHGQVSGKAADIWSMGVTLYCLMFGRIPFEKHGMIELYQAIRSDSPEFDMACNEDFSDLILRLLEKDPEKRITMADLRVRQFWPFCLPFPDTNWFRYTPGLHCEGRIPCYPHPRMLLYYLTLLMKK